MTAVMELNIGRNKLQLTSNQIVPIKQILEFPAAATMTSHFDTLLNICWLSIIIIRCSPTIPIDLGGSFDFCLVPTILNGWIPWLLIFSLESQLHLHLFRKVSNSQLIYPSQQCCPIDRQYWLSQSLSVFLTQYFTTMSRVPFCSIVSPYLLHAFTWCNYQRFFSRLICTALSYAQLANLNPVQGLYAAILPSACYTLLGSSMQVTYHVYILILLTVITSLSLCLLISLFLILSIRINSRLLLILSQFCSLLFYFISYFYSSYQNYFLFSFLFSISLQLDLLLSSPSWLAH